MISNNTYRDIDRSLHTLTKECMERKAIIAKGGMVLKHRDEWIHSSIDGRIQTAKREVDTNRQTKRQTYR